MEITGKVLFLDPVEDVSKTDKVFNIMSFGLDTSVELNGTMAESCAGFQVVGDKVDKFAGINVGDEIKVLFSIRGTKKNKDDQEPTAKNTNSTVIYTNLNAYGVEVIKRATQQAPAPTVNAGEVADDDLPF